MPQTINYSGNKPNITRIFYTQFKISYLSTSNITAYQLNANKFFVFGVIIIGLVLNNSQFLI